jgi:SAM-dependent methyltransferase
MQPTAPEEIAAKVREFYEQMPFNFYGSAVAAAEHVRTNPLRAYPDLDALLSDDSIGNVLELGCGAGWATNAMAFAYGKHVTAVDLTAAALSRAAEVSQQNGTTSRTTFVHADLFGFNPGRTFDLVVSIGVLHHTHDCRRAFAHACRLVAEDGFLFVGLYHIYGRQPFLGYFREILERDGEAAALARFAEISPDRTDSLHLQSWFRDQVLHPQETQHSLEEVLGWLDAAGLTLVTTSINTYGSTENRADLFALEKSFGALSVRRNRVEGRYFPGFFTILARREVRDAPDGVAAR